MYIATAPVQIVSPEKLDVLIGSAKSPENCVKEEAVCPVLTKHSATGPTANSSTAQPLAARAVIWLCRSTLCTSSTHILILIDCLILPITLKIEFLYHIYMGFSLSHRHRTSSKTVEPLQGRLKLAGLFAMSEEEYERKLREMEASERP